MRNYLVLGDPRIQDVRLTEDEMRNYLVLGEPDILDARIAASRSVMPCLQNLAALRSDDSANRVQFVGAEAVTSGQLDRFEPELAGTALSLHVYVRRFIAVEAREEEPIRPRDALDSWHSETSPLVPSILLEQ